VLGVQDGYHLIKSLVASVNIYDTITVSARRDGKITLVNKGIDVGCDILDNNAYKAAKSVRDIFGTNGVDIVIDKKIPVGGGLGGSSADTAGVLNAMNVLYGINGNMEPLACDLGSDTPYMLYGGFAVMKGRGDEVIKKESDKKLYLVIITSEKGISARKCYQLFDEKENTFTSTTDKAVKNLFGGETGSAFKYFKNDLQDSAIELNEEIKYNLYNLKKSGAEVAMIAGSGPSVFAVFDDASKRDKTFNALKLLYGNNIIKAETVVNKNGKFI
jgi:4-diphosphocytidyl-2-C-methyl-D-erythritol kinase